jgi:hypothetical protein
VSTAAYALEGVQDALIKAGEYGLGMGVVRNVAEKGITA